MKVYRLILLYFVCVSNYVAEVSVVHCGRHVTEGGRWVHYGPSVPYPKGVRPVPRTRWPQGSGYGMGGGGWIFQGDEPSAGGCRLVMNCLMVSRPLHISPTMLQTWYPYLDQLRGVKNALSLCVVPSTLLSSPLLPLWLFKWFILGPLSSPLRLIPCIVYVILNDSFRSICRHEGNGTTQESIQAWAL